MGAPVYTRHNFALASAAGGEQTPTAKRRKRAVSDYDRIPQRSFAIIESKLRKRATRLDVDEAWHLNSLLHKPSSEFAEEGHSAILAALKTSYSFTAIRCPHAISEPCITWISRPEYSLPAAGHNRLFFRRTKSNSEFLLASEMIADWTPNALHVEALH